MRDNVQGDGPEDYFRKSITVPFLDYKWNEKKVYRPTRQNRFGVTVGSNYYWKYCSIADPPLPPSKKVSGSAPAACVSIHYRLSAKCTIVLVILDIRFKIIHGSHNVLWFVTWVWRIVVKCYPNNHVKTHNTLWIQLFLKQCDHRRWVVRRLKLKADVKVSRYKKY